MIQQKLKVHRPPGSLLLAGVAALLLALPCWWVLNESAYLAHPSYAHKFGDIVTYFLNYGYDRWRSLVFVGFVVGFTLLQEILLKRARFRLRRMISGVAAILVLAAAASAFVLAVAGPWPRQPVHFFVVILLWHVPWVAYGFLVRSLLVRLENRGTRAAVGLGSLLLLGILMLFCSWRWGVHDGEVQGFLAVAAAIPMVSILAGGLSDLIVRRDALAVHEPTCQHA